MKHEEYKLLLSRIDSEFLPDNLIQEMDEHSESCPVCKMEQAREDRILQKLHPEIVEILIEKGSDFLGIPSEKERKKDFLFLMDEAELQASSYEEPMSVASFSSLLSSSSPQSLKLKIKSFFQPLSFSLALTRTPMSTLSKDLDIFEINLSDIKGAFFIAKPEISFTKNLMRINGIDRLFSGVSVISLIVPFSKFKTLFSLSDYISDEKGIFIEKHLRGLFSIGDFENSILTELQSNCGYLNGKVFISGDETIAEFLLPPGTSKVLESERFCFILLIV